MESLKFEKRTVSELRGSRHPDEFGQSDGACDLQDLSLYSDLYSDFLNSSPAPLYRLSKNVARSKCHRNHPLIILELFLVSRSRVFAAHFFVLRGRKMAAQFSAAYKLDCYTRLTNVGTYE